MENKLSFTKHRQASRLIAYLFSPRYKKGGRRISAPFGGAKKDRRIRAHACFHRQNKGRNRHDLRDINKIKNCKASNFAVF